MYIGIHDFTSALADYMKGLFVNWLHADHKKLCFKLGEKMRVQISFIAIVHGERGLWLWFEILSVEI